MQQFWRVRHNLTIANSVSDVGVTWGQMIFAWADCLVPVRVVEDVITGFPERRSA